MLVKTAISIPGLILATVFTSSVSLADEGTKTECIAANEAAQALRLAGKLVEARSKLAICMDLSCPGPVREDCAERMDDLQAAIPSVVFDVKDAAGRDLVGVKVSIDGTPMGITTATAVPLDPGPHSFRFELPGAPPVAHSLVLLEGETARRVSVVIGGPLTAAAASEPSGTTPGSPTSVGESSAAAAGTDEEQPSSAPTGHSQRLAAWIAGGTGVAALGVSLALILVAKSSYDGADTEGCSGKMCTDSSGLDKSNSARTVGNVATGFFVVGAVATSAGAILWLTAPKAAARTAVDRSWDLGLAFGGIRARGTF
jgi:hypothetical protein